MKEKVVFYEDKQGISVRGSTWTLWIRKVKTKDKGETMYALKPLEAKYNPEKHEFSYAELKNVIWLNKKEMDKLISSLIQLSEEK